MIATVVSVASLSVVSGVADAGAKVGGTAAARVAPSALPAGYVVATSGGPATVLGERQGFVDTSCPNGTKPLGGGESVASTSPDIAMTDSRAVSTVHHDHRDSVYGAGIANGSSVTTSISGYAVCVHRPTSQFTIAQQLVYATVGQQTFAEVPCPTGAVVVGGGVFSGGDGFSATITISSQLPDPSGTGWQVWMNNYNATNATDFTVWAICRNTKPAGYRIVSSPVITNPAGAQTESSVTCPGARVPLSGGAYTTSGDTTVAIASSYPSGHAWINTQSNPSPVDTDTQAWAVCAG